MPFCHYSLLISFQTHFLKPARSLRLCATTHSDVVRTLWSWDACATLSFIAVNLSIHFSKGHVKTWEEEDRDIYAKTASAPTSLFSLMLWFQPHYTYFWFAAHSWEFWLVPCPITLRMGHSPKWTLEETHTAIDACNDSFSKKEVARVHTQRRKVNTNQITATLSP